MKLQNLKNVEKLNSKTIKLILGGLTEESKKKDVSSINSDSTGEDCLTTGTTLHF